MRREIRSQGTKLRRYEYQDSSRFAARARGNRAKNLWDRHYGRKKMTEAITRETNKNPQGAKSSWEAKPSSSNAR
eukprot:1870077-Pleurochrysis_carterae.AAC.1